MIWKTTNVTVFFCFFVTSTCNTCHKNIVSRSVSLLCADMYRIPPPRPSPPSPGLVAICPQSSYIQLDSTEIAELIGKHVLEARPDATTMTLSEFMYL